MKHKTPEANFEQEIEIIARLHKSRYIKIPDTKMINKETRQFHREQKRPFDGVLVTPNGNYCIECKIDNAKLSPHQADYAKIINMVNGSHFVFRKKRLRGIMIYTIEKRDPCVWNMNFNSCNDLIKWFTDYVGKK